VHAQTARPAHALAGEGPHAALPSIIYVFFRRA
jgi:hypothetical protein